IRQNCRVARDRRRVPGALKRLLHAAKIAHFVIDDGDRQGRIPRREEESPDAATASRQWTSILGSRRGSVHPWRARLAAQRLGIDDDFDATIASAARIGAV